MKDKYLNYTLEELADDRDFISWVLVNSENNNKSWDDFLSNHPEFINKVHRAKDIVMLLQDRHDTLDEEAVSQTWDNIARYNSVQFRGAKTSHFVKKVFRYAAVLLVFLTIGTAAYWFLYDSNKGYEFSSDEASEIAGEPRLLLASGEKINLKKDNSSIVVSGEEKILINNEESIDVSQQQNKAEVVKMNEVIIPYGKKSQLLLEDGTKVWLNAGSKLAFPTKFTGKKREVYLEGEGYFEVTHLSSAPFYVNTSDMIVKVLGTRFNVSAYSSDQEIITVLLEGNVSLSDNRSTGLSRKEIILEPDQKANFDRNTKKVNVSHEADSEFFVAWTEGWFKFSQESLLNVMKKLERYYNVKFYQSDSFYSSDMISGKLDLKDSLSEVMVVLSDVADIRYKIENNTVIINNN